MLMAIFPKIKLFYKMRFVSDELEQFFTNLMREALEIRKISSPDRDDYLEYLSQLKAKKKLTDLDTAAHAITFFADGFETSSVFIAFVLYELSMNQDIQNKLREEIKEAASNDGLTFDSVYEMPYLDQICNGQF